MKNEASLLLAIIVVAASYGYILVHQKHQIERLQRDVACLKHPTREASSVGPVTLRNGKVVAGSTVPSVTVCP